MGDEQVREPADGQPNEYRRLVTVRGIRAWSSSAPGTSTWVRVGELVDGWAVFPDPGAAARRWQWLAWVGILVLIGAEWLSRQVGWTWLEAGAPIGILLLLVMLVAGSEISDDRRWLARRRAKSATALRAGGVQAQAKAIRYAGRARTVGEMNVLLSSLGRTDPVFSARSVRKLERDHRWWQTTVRIDLTNGRHLTYRVRGLRGPAKLARILDHARFPEPKRRPAPKS